VIAPYLYEQKSPKLQSCAAKPCAAQPISTSPRKWKNLPGFEASPKMALASLQFSTNPISWQANGCCLLLACLPWRGLNHLSSWPNRLVDCFNVKIPDQLPPFSSTSAGHVLSEAAQDIGSRPPSFKLRANFREVLNRECASSISAQVCS